MINRNSECSDSDLVETNLFQTLGTTLLDSLAFSSRKLGSDPDFLSAQSRFLDSLTGLFFVSVDLSSIDVVETDLDGLIDLGRTDVLGD